MDSKASLRLFFNCILLALFAVWSNAHTAAAQDFGKRLNKEELQKKIDNASRISFDDVRSCRDAPSDAIVDLAQPLNIYFTVVCSKFGHVLALNDEYVLTIVMLAFQKELVTAARGTCCDLRQVDAEANNSHHAYFTRIAQKRLNREEIDSIESRYANEKKLEQFKKLVTEAYRVDLESNKGVMRSIFIFNASEHGFYFGSGKNKELFTMPLHVFSKQVLLEWLKKGAN
ncbi:MAG: hypothetical protein ACRCXM_03430 [Beijerinckiaceae bacterium]